jgi:hypothetical protein
MRQATTSGLSTRVADDANWSSNVQTSTIILVVLLFMVAAAVPIWKHSKAWGYTPSIWLALMIGAHLYSIVTAK